MTSYYLHASILTALALRDEGFAAAAAAISAAPQSPIISDFAWGEFVAAVGRRVRMRAIRATVASRLIADVRAELIVVPPATLAPDDIAEATAMVEQFDLGLKLPDAIHILIARRICGVLLSADRQQIAAARALNVACLNPVSETP